MKIPKKAEKCQHIIDNLVELLRYYMSGTPEFRRIVKEDIQFLETYLQDVSLDHKTHNIRFASKLKAQWKKDMKKKDETIKELKKELDDSHN